MAGEVQAYFQGNDMLIRRAAVGKKKYSSFIIYLLEHVENRSIAQVL